MTQRPLQRMNDFIDIMEPRFEDYEAVFDGWPYILVVESRAIGRMLVLGTLVGLTHDGDVIRRGCVVDELPLSGPRLTHRGGNLRRMIWLLPYDVGVAVRFWTHIGDRDRDCLARFVFTDENGLVEVSTSGELMEHCAAAG